MGSNPIPGAKTIILGLKFLAFQADVDKYSIDTLQLGYESLK